MRSGYNNLIENWDSFSRPKKARGPLWYQPLRDQHRSGDPLESAMSHNFYILLRYDFRTRRFEVFLEHAAKVVEGIEPSQKRERQRQVKEWALCFNPGGEQDRLKRQWEEFGRNALGITRGGRK